MFDNVQDQREYFSDGDEYDILEKRSKSDDPGWSEEDEDSSDEESEIDDDDYIDDTEPQSIGDDHSGEAEEAVTKELLEAEERMAKQRTISKDAFLAWTREIGTDKIDKTYQVHHERPPKRPHDV
ncbi:hypothetical protein EC968_007518, partial [Mortierella alpina]